MLAGGIGEELTEVEISLKGKFILMVYPDIHISTKQAYSNVIPKKPKKCIRQILVEKNITEWKHFLKNDFEEAIFGEYPILMELKQQLYKSGAIYASMSGSGSCMYGIFQENPQITFPEHFKTWTGKL